MKRLTFREHLACGFLATGVLVASAVGLPEPAWAQRSDHAKAEPNVTLPKAKPIRCTTPFSAIAILPGWTVLEGRRARAYLSTMFTPTPDGDALAYMVRGDKVALVAAVDGCVVGARAVPEKVHQNTVKLALGIVA